MKKAWTWKNVELPAKAAEKIHMEFQLALYRTALEFDPENMELLVFLGDTYTRHGMTRDGLEIDERLVRVCPNEPTFHYNLACSHALLNQVDPAFQALERAIQLGYQNFDHLQNDQDLDNLRNDRRFQELVQLATKGH